MTVKLKRSIMIMALVALTGNAWAHCDAVDGPVVLDAKAAIAAGDVSPVLKWIAPEDEGEIREAFARTLEARKSGDEVAELADQWFFETLVRVHRESEGAPYTGLKPAGTDPGVALRRGDQALEEGSVAALEAMIVEKVRDGIRERFHAALESREHANHNAQAGRRFVEAYTEFMHYVDRLHRDATTNAMGDGSSAKAAGHDH